jgi:hypothetical protein
MYANGKMRLLKLFQEWEEEGIKENNGGGTNSTMIYV